MSSNIPHARQLLHTALTLDMSEEARALVYEALSYMTRTSTKTRAPVEARKVTRLMAIHILKMHERQPYLSCRAIGEIFNINGGRVSEIIAAGYAGVEAYE